MKATVETYIRSDWQLSKRKEIDFIFVDNLTRYLNVILKSFELLISFSVDKPR